MFSILRSFTQFARLPVISSKFSVINQCTNSFHTLNKINITTNILQSRILQPLVIPNCGFKVKGMLRRRCKDCYFVKRQQRLYVICKTHPRHKQMSMVPKEKNTWILTHATQGKIRPW